MSGSSRGQSGANLYSEASYLKAFSIFRLFADGLVDFDKGPGNQALQSSILKVTIVMGSGYSLMSLSTS